MAWTIQIGPASLDIAGDIPHWQFADTYKSPVEKTLHYCYSMIMSSYIIISNHFIMYLMIMSSSIIISNHFIIYLMDRVWLYMISCQSVDDSRVHWTDRSLRSRGAICLAAKLYLGQRLGAKEAARSVPCFLSKQVSRHDIAWYKGYTNVENQSTSSQFPTVCFT